MSDDRASRLEDDGHAEPLQLRHDRGRVLRGRDHWPALIRDAESAAEIDVLDAEAVLGQIHRQRHERVSRAPQRLRRRDLRSDVDVHADELQARQARGARA